MLKQNVFGLRMITKIGTVVAILAFASACTHQQLKQEAEVSAVEETTAPTPDVGGVDATSTDPLAAPTAIPGDVAPKKARVKHAPKHGHASKHKKTHKIAKKKHKKTKTMLAKGSVESQLPPPPGPEVGAPAPEMTMPVPPAPQDAATLAAPADLGGEGSGGHGLVIVLGLIALGALAFAGVRLRSSRGSRRLVFN